MEQPGSADIFLFEGFRFDRAGGCLFRTNGPDVAEPVALGSRALALLGLLLERQGQSVTKDEIFGVVWSGMAIEEANLTVQISALRRLLDRDRQEGSCIQTVPGRGYRFVCPVTRGEVYQSSNDPVVADGPARSPPRLSIVVLPFANLSDDREQQYFADGIAEDLATDLSRLANMFVISRNTAFTYRNKSIDTRQIGRELGVRYVLEGSVRRSANQVRVTAQLIDAETDAHLWAERFDRDMGDLFALQNEITSCLANALGVELIAAEASRPTEHPDALDYILRGRAVVSNPRSRKRYAEAISLFERALELDPQSVAAQSWLTSTLANRVINHMTDTPAADIARAERLVQGALTASPTNATAHFARGELLRAQRRHEEAIREYEMVLAFDRNSASALLALGHSKLMTGAIGEVIPLIERAIGLSPRDPQIAVMHYRIGEVRLLESRNDEAIRLLEKACSENPELCYVHAFRASAYARNGAIERAATELAEARRLAGNDRYSSIAQVRAGGYYEVPKVLALFETTYFDGLRKAGVPEE